MPATTSSFEAEILRRVVDPQRAGWSRDAAESILALSFSAEDIQRASALAAKASTGELTPDEEHEMAGFRHVGRFLELLQSRARLSLKALQAA